MHIPVPAAMVAECLDIAEPPDALFVRVRQRGLSSTQLAERSGLARVTGAVAESVPEVLLAEVGVEVFWHVISEGVHGVDLLLLTPDDSVLAWK